MLDKNKIDNFFARRAQMTDPNMATHYKEDDTILFDIGLIENYIDSSSAVLDLGCGPGRTTNVLESKVSYIKAVDKQRAFLDFCNKSPKIETAESDLTIFNDNNKYDVIILFGVITYLNDEEVKSIYNNCFAMLKDNGVLLVKHACGIEEDVVIDHYSEQVGDWYHVLYRHTSKDELLLQQSGFKSTMIDIYPERLNPWKNTHYYAFVAEKALR